MAYSQKERSAFSKPPEVDSEEEVLIVDEVGHRGVKSMTGDLPMTYSFTTTKRRPLLHFRICIASTYCSRAAIAKVRMTTINELLPFCGHKSKGFRRNSFEYYYDFINSGTLSCSFAKIPEVDFASLEVE